MFKVSVLAKTWKGDISYETKKEVSISKSLSAFLCLCLFLWSPEEFPITLHSRPVAIFFAGPLLRGTISCSKLCCRGGAALCLCRRLGGNKIYVLIQGSISQDYHNTLCRFCFHLCWSRSPFPGINYKLLNLHFSTPRGSAREKQMRRRTNPKWWTGGASNEIVCSESSSIGMLSTSLLAHF